METTLASSPSPLILCTALSIQHNTGRSKLHILSFYLLFLPLCLCVQPPCVPPILYYCVCILHYVKAIFPVCIVMCSYRVAGLSRVAGCVAAETCTCLTTERRTTLTHSRPTPPSFLPSCIYCCPPTASLQQFIWVICLCCCYSLVREGVSGCAW